MGTTAFIVAMFAVPGVAIGSFSNVVVSRMPLRLPIGTSRSRCMTCSSEISARDNIPLLSFLLLRGRCRSCGNAIPWRYPAVEASTAALVALCGAVFGLTADALVAASFCAVLVVISAIEIERGVVPDRLVLPAAAAALVVQTVFHPSPLWAVSGLAAALCLSAIAVNRPVSTGALGLSTLLGAVLGPVVVVALVLGSAGAFALGVVLNIRVGRAPFGIAVPLAPFLSAGSILVLLAGSGIPAAHSVVGL
jgi:prepilin signal peptidase PulO-like enzyme (type II secretory pathway)